MTITTTALKPPSVRVLNQGPDVYTYFGSRCRAPAWVLVCPLPRVCFQVDLIEQMGPLPFNLEFFTECQDMRQLLAYLDAPPDTGEATDGAGDDEEQDDESNRDRSGNGSSETRARECGSERRQDGGEAEAAARVDGGGGGGGGGDGGGRRRGRKERFHKLTEEICDVVDSYGLVCFYPLNIQVRLSPSQGALQVPRV